MRSRFKRNRTGRFSALLHGDHVRTRRKRSLSVTRKIWKAKFVSLVFLFMIGEILAIFKVWKMGRDYNSPITSPNISSP